MSNGRIGTDPAVALANANSIKNNFVPEFARLKQAIFKEIEELSSKWDGAANSEYAKRAFSLNGKLQSLQDTMMEFADFINAGTAKLASTDEESAAAASRLNA